MVLYLGSHLPHWLASVDLPLMISHRRLAKRRSLPRATTPWVLDSGGFTELAMYGRWTITPTVYAAAVRRYADEIGNLTWSAPMDWMVEPFMLAKTGLSVAEHQARTVGNYLDLMEAAPDLPWLPVLQGWTLADYERCAVRYDRVGVDLAAAPVVGLGSVCRRQATGEIERIVTTLAGLGLNLHGFGVKTLGLARYADALTSADSLAWSYNARRRPALPGCTHRSCANCARWATRWHARIQRGLTCQQLRLDLQGAAHG